MVTFSLHFRSWKQGDLRATFVILKSLFYADDFLQSPELHDDSFARKEVQVAFKSFLLKISWKLNFLSKTSIRILIEFVSRLLLLYFSC